MTGAGGDFDEFAEVEGLVEVVGEAAGGGGVVVLALFVCFSA